MVVNWNLKRFRDSVLAEVPRHVLIKRSVSQLKINNFHFLFCTKNGLGKTPSGTFLTCHMVGEKHLLHRPEEPLIKSRTPQSYACWAMNWSDTRVRVRLWSGNCLQVRVYIKTWRLNTTAATYWHLASTELSNRRRKASDTKKINFSELYFNKTFKIVSNNIDDILLNSRPV